MEVNFRSRPIAGGRAAAQVIRLKVERAALKASRRRKLVAGTSLNLLYSYQATYSIAMQGYPFRAELTRCETRQLMVAKTCFDYFKAQKLAC